MYLIALVHADATGVAEAIQNRAHECGLTDARFDAAKLELEKGQLVTFHVERFPIAQLGNGGYVMDWRLDCYINDFVSPITHDRLSPESWVTLRDVVFARDNYTCQYCKATKVELECDHVEPISRGGSNELGNLITSCGPCNKSKRDKWLTEWRGRNNGG